MKIKPLDKYLMVVLSKAESDYLGFGTDMRIRSFHTEYIVSNLFAAACSFCDFSIKGDTVDISVFPGRNGETVLLFSEFQRKKYRVKEGKNPLLCFLPDCDALIGLVSRLKNTNEKITVFLYEEKYVAIGFLPLLSYRETRSMLGEYGEIRRFTRKLFRSITKSGKVIWNS